MMNTKPLKHPAEFEALCDDAKKRVIEISTDEVLNNKEKFILIDVRDKDEFEAGHLPDANFLSKGWIEAKIHNLVNDKDTKVVLYCGGGNRSLLAADNIQKMGYTNVYSMCGGFKQWVRDGKSVTKE
jgi:rhodanese-related sulfurtransferase